MTDLTINKYLISTKSGVSFDKARYRSAEVKDKWVYAFAVDLSQLGYSIDATLFQKLTSLNAEDFQEFTAQIIQLVREVVGAHVQYRPLFKNFPTDVPDDFGYYIRRLMGFLFQPTDGVTLSCGCRVSPELFDVSKFNACPICQRQVEELGNEPQFFLRIASCAPEKVLTWIGHPSLRDIFRNILAAKSSISAHDKEFVTHMIGNLQPKEVESWFPAAIPFKENVGLALGELLKKDPDLAQEYAVRYLHTATDILRLIVQLSGGDVSLARPCKIKLNNPQRRFIMRLMNKKLPLSSLEEMKPYRQRWLRVAEVLHYGCYKTRYAKMYKLLDTLQNHDATIKTFDSKIQALLPLGKEPGAAKNLPKILKLLDTRPGMFARRLNELLTKFDNADLIVSTFKEATDQLSVKLLLQLITYFESRNYQHEVRFFMPKGSMAKMQVIPDERKLLDDKRLKPVLAALNTALQKKLKKLPKLGRVYVDQALRDIPVPFTQRSASKTSNPMIRGARIPFDAKASVLRLFTYWKENETSDRIDVDLAAAGLGKDFQFVSHISWTRIHETAMGVHSGDIQSAPNGASEFIDINLSACRQSGIRYIAANVYSYTRQKFDTFECFAGIMEKAAVNVNEHYNPLDVKVKFDLTSEGTMEIPMLIDLEEAELIWMDLASTSGQMLEYSSAKVINMCRALAIMLDHVPSLYELFTAHATARGKLTTKAADAKIVFDMASVKSIDKILSEYL